MKVYVDKLPKSCENCPFCQIETHVEFVGYTTNSYSCVLDGSMITGNCPLQSLADYTKQVRKELIDKLALFLIETFSKDADFSVEEILNWFQEVKHQIQGE